MKKHPRRDPARELIEAHPRDFRANRYVYPVVSRRAGGISIGVNLNLDKVCNFHCVYCQVDRAESGRREFIQLDRLVDELNATVELVTSGRIYEDPRFAKTPSDLRRLNDIAISGDGEPTIYRNFDRVVSACAEVRRRHAFRKGAVGRGTVPFSLRENRDSPQAVLRSPVNDVKLVLITNASMFHRDWVQRGLEILDAEGGEIWAKLDAGTDEYYRLVARSAVSFGRILHNLTTAARARPIVIQSLFMRIHGEPPSASQQQAYCDRLNEIITGGGRIKLVQLYTVARPPAEPWVTPLSDTELAALADLVHRRTGLSVARF